MKVLGKELIDKYCKKHNQVASSLLAWHEEALNAVWKKPQDIKDRFGSVDFLPKNHAIFNINGNHHRLVVLIQYNCGVVAVKWIGTHAEYDRKNDNGGFI